MKPAIPVTLLTLAALLLSVQRMPAPITVPPESKPAVNISPEPEKKDSEKKVSGSHSKKKEPAQHRISLAGTWTGNAKTINGATTLYTVTISADEKTSWTSWINTMQNNAVTLQASCRLVGDKLRWSNVQRDDGGGPPTWESTVTLTPVGNNSAKMVDDTRYILGPRTGQHIILSGILHR